MCKVTRKVEHTMNVAIARAGLQPAWQKQVDAKMPSLGLKTGVARLPGEISADSLYTLDELNDRLGLGKSALRSARREGLTVKRIGRRGYVLGRDVINWFERSAKQV